jgi:AraC-like DNA-binding protein
VDEYYKEEEDRDMMSSDFIGICNQYLVDQDRGFVGLPQLLVYRRDAISDVEASVYEPIICLIVQGSKITSIGDRSVQLTPGDALLVTHDLPVVSRITKASVQEPYIAVILSLDLDLVRNLDKELASSRTEQAQASSLSVGPADPAWLEPLGRYLKLKDNPQDARVLGPALLREIHYRLMLSPLGAMMGTFSNADSQAGRVAMAIQRLRNEYKGSLSVADLAKTAGMSVSSFHQHFRSVTETTPLQYQKDLRLIAARDLLVNKNFSVSQASFEVGYESPTHFSRAYREKYGRPPSKDTRSEL